MSQTYTGNILLTIQSVDNITVETIFNHAVPNLINTGIVSTVLQVIAAFSGTYTIASGAVKGIYILNTGTNPLTVSWNNGSGQVTVIVLGTGSVLFFFVNTGTGLVSNVTIAASSATTVEYAFWA